MKSLEEELNSNKKINKKISIIKDIKRYNTYMGKLANILDKSAYNYFLNYKKEFIFKLKIVYLVAYMKKIIYNKIRDTNIIKYIKKLKKYKSEKVYYPKIKKQKMKNNNVQQISNIYIKDKIYLNNIIINENILNSGPFDYNKNLKNIDTPELKEIINYKNNPDKFEQSDLGSKKENIRFNING